MPYGQKNYNELQGNAPQKYRINQIGCFLTAFCNLIERFGHTASPLDLNRYMINNNIYIDVDDGVRDDLGWQSICAVDSRISIVHTSNTPPAMGNQITDANSIVRIAANNIFGTHFCAVADTRDGIDPLIIDSWDGQVKLASTYGKVTGFAIYKFTPTPVIVPQAVTPVVPPPVVEPVIVTTEPVVEVESDIPADPNAWMNTYEEKPERRLAVESIPIHDLSGVNHDLTLSSGRTLSIAGRFTKDGVEYLRTTQGAARGYWYGIPTTSTASLEPEDQPEITDEELTSIDMEIKEYADSLAPREKIVAFVAKVQAFFISLFTFKWLRKNKKEQ